MARILVGLVAVLALAGCAPAAHAKPVSAQSIALQPGDVAGLKGCDAGGDMQTVLTKEKSIDTFLYDQNATEWEQWKTQGATEAYFAVYGRTAADCAVYASVAPCVFHCSHSVAFWSYKNVSMDFSFVSTVCMSPPASHPFSPATSPGCSAMLCPETGLP